MKLIALLIGTQLSAALRVPAPGALKITRSSFIHAAGLGLLVPPAAQAEMFTTAADCTGIGMCSGAAKTQLASYDVMLLEKAKTEIGEMSEGATGAKASGFDECKRLVGLVLDLDWKSLDAAASKLDPSQGSTQRLSKGIKAKDPKITAKAVLEIAEDLDVTTSIRDPLVGQPAMAPPSAGNPFDPRNQK